MIGDPNKRKALEMRAGRYQRGMHASAKVELLNGAQPPTVLATLTMPAVGWDLTAEAEGGGRLLRIIPAEAGTTDADMEKVGSFFYYPDGTGQKLRYGNGERNDWATFADQEWRLKGYKRVERVPAPVSTGFPYTFPLTFE